MFSNTSQIRIFITEINVEIKTHWIRILLAVNATTILVNTKYCKISFVWNAVPVIKRFSKEQNINILNILHTLRRRFQTVVSDYHVPETVPRYYAKRVCCKKCHLSWYDLNETFLHWIYFFVCRSDLARSPVNIFCTKRLIIRQAIVYEYQDEKQHN